MSAFSPHLASNGAGTGLHPQRTSIDSLPSPPNETRMPAERNGTLPMPVGHPQRGFGGMQADMGGYGHAGMPRSPPKNKNTQHVPCKFFMQGQCQAGRMCPFSHDLESATKPALCKYFTKGSCKFGRKCALLHVTQDGITVNRAPPYHSGPQYINAQPPPSQPTAFQQPPPPGLLSMQAQALAQQPNGEVPQDFEHYQWGPVPPMYTEMVYNSASPEYGSPPQDTRIAASPPRKGLSVLDAPLPNSFDSNGISMAARNGPLAASVPSRFGVESPPASLPSKAQVGNTALRHLHSSAFGDIGMDGVLAGSSPPSGPDEPLTFPKRPLPTDRLRRRDPPQISASLGTKLPTQSFEYSDDDDGGDADREEDLLPASLRDLIPDNRPRRESRPRTEDENTPASFLAAQRRTISGQTPQDSKVTSPHSSSPSRFTGMFSRNPNGRIDSEGNVGSPLRNSAFAFGQSPPRTVSGDLSPAFSSPPRQTSMSMLTQGLQRTTLDPATQAASSVGMSRNLSNGSTGRTSLDRAMSSTSVGREKIDEELEVFNMDEERDQPRVESRSIPIRNSHSGSPWTVRPFGSSPPNAEAAFGAIGGHRSPR